MMTMIYNSVDVTGDKYWMVLINNEFSTSSYWADGSSSTYRRWESGRPDADEKTCVYYEDGGLFIDESCKNEQRYTCKMAAGKLHYNANQKVKHS